MRIYYHGADGLVLQMGVGHLEGSGLPVGGGSTHCVISGHRGLSSAKLFTDLDQLESGDTLIKPRMAMKLPPPLFGQRSVGKTKGGLCMSQEKIEPASDLADCR